MRISEVITESQVKTVTRIDSKPIGDFASDLKTYRHTDDWSQSGIDTGDDSYWTKNNLKTQTNKGLFAGDPHRTALYATGNAHETRYVEFEENGQPVVYFDKRDLPKIRSRKTYLTVFDAANFKKLPTGEYFSENPGMPLQQTEIGDKFQYIADHGWVVRITDDLNKLFKKVQALHKAGKIEKYGAEGMGESVEEDMSRRGFLGALGAAGAAAVAPSMAQAKAAPHAKPKVDPHSTKVQQIVQAPKVDPDTARRILSSHAINSGMTEPVELAQFLAQCSAETGNFAHLGEIGRPAKLAHKYAHSTGNAGQNDALMYAGRGYIQLTGKSNYIEAGAGVHGDESYYVEHPNLAADPKEAAKIATWFWNKNVKPRVKNFADTATVTRAINGRAAPQHEIKKRDQLFATYYPAVKQWASRKA